MRHRNAGAYEFICSYSSPTPGPRYGFADYRHKPTGQRIVVRCDQSTDPNAEMWPQFVDGVITQAMRDDWVEHVALERRAFIVWAADRWSGAEFTSAIANLKPVPSNIEVADALGGVEVQV